MPKVTGGTALPDALLPYRAHGVEFSWAGGTRQAEGDCPFCGKVGKWLASAVGDKAGTWGCKVCGEEGNAYTFLRLLHAESERTTSDHAALARDRRLLHADTLVAWGVCRSPLTGDWLVPGHNVEGKLTQLYQYRKGRDGKMTLFPTPTLGHTIHLQANYDLGKPEVMVCEGPWDGMALWEVLQRAKRTEDGLTQTANEKAALAATVNVVAVPGCGSIGEPFRRWLPLFAGKRVTLCFDSDHPRTHNGVQQEPAGYAACKRAAGLLTECVPPTVEVRYLRWGEDGYDPQHKSGYDVRDMLTEARK